MSGTASPPTDAEFLERVAEFCEAHGRDDGGYSAETRAEFRADAARLRRLAARLSPPTEQSMIDERARLGQELIDAQAPLRAKLSEESRR
jgi:alkanesulfonate monooxygenase SsuD/methylene tetrahydromethanopterin reductase-like flavin-dependent oxidoreductase (luciferase family)